jgi:hypothetical protein
MAIEPQQIDSLPPDRRVIPAVEARQGVISGRVVLVLLTSTLLAVVALRVVYLVGR